APTTSSLLRRPSSRAGECSRSPRAMTSWPFQAVTWSRSRRRGGVEAAPKRLSTLVLRRPALCSVSLALLHGSASLSRILADTLGVTEAHGQPSGGCVQMARPPCGRGDPDSQAILTLK